MWDQIYYLSGAAVIVLILGIGVLLGLEITLTILGCCLLGILIVGLLYHYWERRKLHLHSQS